MCGREVDDGRGYWGSKLEFVLATIGQAVGLGNIWRFSAVAYNNGGSAFLIPYITLVIFFGLPTMYLEMAIGQYTSSGPSTVFRHYIPALQGMCGRVSALAWMRNVCTISTTTSAYLRTLLRNILGVGWSMTCVGVTICIYYCLVVSWIFMYLSSAATGGLELWASCSNEWNDICHPIWESCTLQLYANAEFAHQ
ncbi:unnamed protein product [Angiostrongylus costaricensis]|uniref:Transporter n=1 Tax=Angiostrongylus costaricensis TaxID=334426 RepID=A0A0R3PY66_ANGCS|nr:unnamed protein product [Angiostrongylus costaricensis]